MIELQSTERRREFLRAHHGGYAQLARKLGVDRTNLKNAPDGGTMDLRFGAEIRRIFCERGAPPLRFPDEVDAVIERFRVIDRMLRGVEGGKVVDPTKAMERVRAVEALWKDRALRLLSDSIHAAYDPTDDDEKILAVCRNLIGLHANIRFAETLMTGRLRAPEGKRRVLLALKQAHAAFVIVESAQGRPGTVKDAEKGSGPLLAPEVAVLRLYVLYQTVSILSKFREDFAKKTHGLSVFTTEDVTAELKQRGSAPYKKILDVYPAKHPNRLQLALDVISIGSLLEDAPLALKAWGNAAEENAQACDMKNLLIGRDRRLAESDMTQWIRDQVGDRLPPKYLLPNLDLIPAHTKEDHDHA